MVEVTDGRLYLAAVLIKILKYFTPLSIVSVAAIVATLYFLSDSKTAGEAKAMIIPGLLVVSAICIGLDILARFIFKHKVHWIWLSEALMIFALVYFWIVQ